MNPSFFGGAAVLLVLALWWAGRRKPIPLLRSTDGAAIAALNRAQIAALDRPEVMVVDPSTAGTPEASPAAAVPDPGSPAGRALLLRRLVAALGQDPVTRLEAVNLARAWGHRCTVPLLLRGLRDSDPAVVRESVLAMERFRGRTAAPDPECGLAQLPLPRNVSRTR
jgi:hypothetical protein